MESPTLNFTALVVKGIHWKVLRSAIRWEEETQPKESQKAWLTTQPAAGVCLPAQLYSSAPAVSIPLNEIAHLTSLTLEKRLEMNLHCSPVEAFTISEEFCPSFPPDTSLLS